jgi:actin-related protein 8
LTSTLRETTLTFRYQGFFKPQIFDHSDKLAGRRKLVPRSLDLYDGRPNDPISQAQLAVVDYARQNIPSTAVASVGAEVGG